MEEPQTPQKTEVFETVQDPSTVHVPGEPLPPQSARKHKAKNSFSTTFPNSCPTRISTTRAPRRTTKRDVFAPRRRTDPTGDLLLHDKSDQIQRASMKIILGEEISEDDPTVLGLVVVDLQNKMNKLESRGLFKESTHMQQCIEKARNAQLEATKTEAQRQALMDIEIRKGHTETDIDIFGHFYEAKASSIDVRFDELERKLIERQQKEIKEHEDEWVSDAKNRVYCHVSNKLRNLKDMQEKLVKAKRYEEASIVGDEADIIEKQEAQRMSIKRMQDYENSLSALHKKHQDERNLLHDTKQTKLQMLKIATENGGKAIENRKKALKYNEDIAKDKEKLWKLKHRNDQHLIRMLDPNLNKPSKEGNCQARCVQLKLPPLVTNHINSKQKYL